MKDTLQDVKEALGEDAYKNPKKVFVYDSGEDAPFTACQGMPGDILKSAGAISIFNDIEAGWATPSWEEVVERDPDAILLLDYDGDVEEKAEQSKAPVPVLRCICVQCFSGRLFRFLWSCQDSPF